MKKQLIELAELLKKIKQNRVQILGGFLLF